MSSTPLWAHLFCSLCHSVTAHTASILSLYPSHLSSLLSLSTFVIFSAPLSPFLAYLPLPLTLRPPSCGRPHGFLSFYHRTQKHTYTLGDWKHHASLPCWKALFYTFSFSRWITAFFLCYFILGSIVLLFSVICSEASTSCWLSERSQGEDLKGWKPFLLISRHRVMFLLEFVLCLISCSQHPVCFAFRSHSLWSVIGFTWTWWTSFSPLFKPGLCFHGELCLLL